MSYLIGFAANRRLSTSNASVTIASSAEPFQDMQKPIMVNQQRAAALQIWRDLHASQGHVRLMIFGNFVAAGLESRRISSGIASAYCVMHDTHCEAQQKVDSRRSATRGRDEAVLPEILLLLSLQRQALHQRQRVPTTTSAAASGAAAVAIGLQSKIETVLSATDAYRAISPPTPTLPVLSARGRE